MNVRLIEYDGEEYSVEALAKKFNLPPATLRSRIFDLGWPVVRAVTTPVDRRFSARSGRPKQATPRPVPKLKKHATGQAYARWQVDGKEHSRYFGAYGSTEANEAYRRFSVEWVNGAGAVAHQSTATTIARLTVLYHQHAERYYRKYGKPTSEIHLINSAIAVLVDLFGSKEIRDFTADDLRACQSSFVNRGLARRTVNSYVSRIRRVFSWGAGQLTSARLPLVDAGTLAQVLSVRDLAKGRTKAKDAARKKSVPDADIDATIKVLEKLDSRYVIVADLIRFHRLTGMRSAQLLRMTPAQLLRMTPAQVDRSGSEWCYRVSDEHDKNAHRGEGTGSAVYWIGPKAQKILEPLFAGCPDDRPLFALPRLRCEGCRVLSVGDYRVIVRKACKLAGVKRWHPHQLRHNRATDVAKIYESTEAAAKAIGDTPDVTREVYIDPSELIRRRIARETG